MVTMKVLDTNGSETGGSMAIVSEPSPRGHPEAMDANAYLETARATNAHSVACRTSTCAIRCVTVSFS
jgi:hypothetical protein